MSTNLNHSIHFTLSGLSLPLSPCLDTNGINFNQLTGINSNTSRPNYHDLAHLAFCALVALQTAVQGGAVTSPMAEHLFIVRWLATAQKQKRFPKTVAIDIQLLLDKGRKQGIGGQV
jgi:hypothetical protein